MIGQIRDGRIVVGLFCNAAESDRVCVRLYTITWGGGARSETPARVSLPRQ